MRPSGSPEGFTLLEMTLALGAAGLLVALLAGAWIALARNGMGDERLRSEERLRDEQLHLLERMLRGALWSPASLQPNGSLAWNPTPGTLALWSRETSGRVPGPAQWSFQPHASGLRATVQDAWGGSSHTLELPGLKSIRMEVCLHQSSAEGEQVAWIPLHAWPPGVPFRPAAFRLGIEQPPRDLQWVTVWP